MTNPPPTSSLQQISTEDYAFITENGGQLTSIQDHDNKIIYASLALETLLGYSRGELVGKSYADLFSPGNFQSVQNKVASVQRSSKPMQENCEIRRKDDKSLWVSIQFQKMIPSGSTSRFAAFYQDQNRIKRIEDVLASLAFDPAMVPDLKFFEGLVWHTALVLDIDYAFLTVTQPPYNTVRMLAFWKGSGFADPYEYNLDGTPCDRVIRNGETCLVPIGVQGIYPKDQDLVALNAQSYLGVPIYDHLGHIKGHLALLDRQPLKMTEFRRSVTVLFARQVSVILEKLYPSPA